MRHLEISGKGRIKSHRTNRARRGRLLSSVKTRLRRCVIDERRDRDGINNKKRARRRLSPGSLTAACENGKIIELATKYICQAENGTPNIAGFCRYMGAGVSEFQGLKQRYPEIYDALCAIFEDEALNSALSPSVVSLYLRERLGYDGDKRDDGSVTVVFEHDVLNDGS